MPNISAADTWAILMTWEARHTQPITDVDRGQWTIESVGGKDFALVYAINLPDYPCVLGYYLRADGTLLCRHFYKSRSEASWRVGTGARWEYQDKLGRNIVSGWVKSAEGQRGHISGGYIFEGMVVPELEKKLETWFQTNHRNAQHTNILTSHDPQRFPFSQHPMTPAYSKHHNLFINDGRNPGGGSELVLEYHRERHYYAVIPRNVYAVDGQSDDENRQSKQRLLGRTTQGSVPMQNDLRNEGGRTGLAHDIKRHDALWGWVVSCLQAEDAALLVTRKPHDILGMSHSIQTFNLTRDIEPVTVKVEVARTDTAIHQTYVTPSGIQLAINSPICWVRSVYIPGTVSTFGNYVDIPIDLAFLVQKPCDYVSQVAEEVASRLGVQTQLTENKREFIEAADRRHRFGHSYISLALFNETTSPLVKAYKVRNHLATFQYKYRALPNTRGELPELLLYVMLGVKTYLDLFDESRGGQTARSHGSVGVNRANTFLEHISQARYQSEHLPRDLYELFAHDRVNGRRMGRLLGDGINSKRHSLFTMVCKSLLSRYFQPGMVGLQGFGVALGAPGLRVLKTALPVGVENSIQRVVNKAAELNMDGSALELEVEKHSAALLLALRANR